ncbi:hypothetical protein Rrhod_0572 [Rhodococcus rhodnii LMG 5362]|uniref:Uncharacterized protein n=1 Tax=Rhodococcus rhodnii LMG 5362 TaxID=1273125 RepID=R7WRU5_9NOCA|nr:hypothetical protein Rrhod_0572 [Rhodococcus rhodnii LMG 5362]
MRACVIDCHAPFLEVIEAEPMHLTDWIDGGLWRVTFRGGGWHLCAGEDLDVVAAP